MFTGNEHSFTMKTIICKTQLPKKKWPKYIKGADRALSIWDISITRYGLKAKTLIFKNNRDLCYFWKHGLGKDDLERKCTGAVNSLAIYHHDPVTMEQTAIEVDKNFFCVIGLIKGHMTNEVLTHEAGHAAIHYYRRVNGNKNIWEKKFDFNEEGFCYPLGIIASHLLAIRDEMKKETK